MYFLLCSTRMTYIDIKNLWGILYWFWKGEKFQKASSSVIHCSSPIIWFEMHFWLCIPDKRNVESKSLLSKLYLYYRILNGCFFLLVYEHFLICFRFFPSPSTIPKPIYLSQVKSQALLLTTDCILCDFKGLFSLMSKPFWIQVKCIWPFLHMYFINRKGSQNTNSI